MIDEETARIGIAMLSVAAAELIEDVHGDLLNARHQSHIANQQQVSALRNLGDELSALGAAAEVLARCSMKSD